MGHDHEWQMNGMNYGMRHVTANTKSQCFPVALKLSTFQKSNDRHESSFPSLAFYGDFFGRSTLGRNSFILSLFDIFSFQLTDPISFTSNVQQ